MGRQYHVNGETLVSVKGRADSTIAALSPLGLTDVAGKVTITLDPRFSDINVDAWGNQTVPETQSMLGEAQVGMTLVHFDRVVLEACEQLSLGNLGNAGQLTHAGTLMGGNVDRLVAGNNYIGLTLYSPIEGRPWCFYTTILTDVRYPLGTEKSLVQLTWRVIPYTIDPWNGGLGAAAARGLWTNSFFDGQ